ncbi:hypothetical protein ACFE04_015339 [Oxalis oulophora]
MGMGRRGAEKREENVAVAIDKDKGSQYALKWAVDNILERGQSLTLLHVKQNKTNNSSVSATSSDGTDARNSKIQLEKQAREMFLPFRCFCARKELKCNEILLDDTDIPRAIVDFAICNSIDILVLGAPSRSGLMRRFKTNDVPSNVSRAAPDFCSVYVIGSRGKINSLKSATAKAPKRPSSPSHSEISLTSSDMFPTPRSDRSSPSVRNSPDEYMIRSPFTRGRGYAGRYDPPPPPESDISYVSSGRPSMDRPSFECMDSPAWGSSAGSEYDPRSFGSSNTGSRPSTQESSSTWSSNSMDDVESEMRRLRQELHQTMEMYSSACKEAIVQKQKATELNRWKAEEEQKLDEARSSEKAAMAHVHQEQAKAKAAMEAAEAAQRIAHLETQKRKDAEKNALKTADERKKTTAAMSNLNSRCRTYTIEEIEAATDSFAAPRKIGEGGYGPVYKGTLDHTPVAIKILRPDANQGRAQFQQEVEVLSRMRHPNMVLLLGVCPEYGCLVYEHMVNGSLEDCLFRRENSPVLPWQARFRIAAEIATGLLFLHQSKPEPLVHRDLKPGNILLDRNFVSKISDVGLARLVPPSIANSVTQYHMTSAAGTFCYIDPEYQQTGMLGTKSDVYSFGILLLQIITAKPPMGLTHHVERAIEKGTFAGILDQAVHDWPVEEALCFAKLALQCAELRRKDRPDLGKVVLPELNRLRVLAEENTPNFMYGGSSVALMHHSQASRSSMQDVISDCQSPSTASYESH